MGRIARIVVVTLVVILAGLIAPAGLGGAAAAVQHGRHR